MSKAEDKHYAFTYQGIKVDPYRIFEIYGITNPAQQHAIKKLLRAGKSIKSLSQDIDEVILTLNRWKEMVLEDASAKKGVPTYFDIEEAHRLAVAGNPLFYDVDALREHMGLSPLIYVPLGDINIRQCVEPKNSYAEVHKIVKSKGWAAHNNTSM